MKICIDAGHYGKYNRSPVNSDYWESEMTWKLHLMLKEELEKFGVTVITTRNDQKVDLGLAARGRKAQGCDLFLSVHSNACGIESVDYPLACCCVSGRCDALGLKLAKAVRDVMGCKQDGRIIKKQNTHGTGDWYSVLFGASQVGVPGILLENGFHTNKANTNWLLNEDNLRKLARVEAETIAAHYGLQRQADTAPAENPQTSFGGYFLIKVTANELNVRKDAGVEYPITTKVVKGYVYTIVETKKAKDGGTWGKLKSGAGWVNISPKYVQKV